MALPTIFATQPSGNVPAATLDANFNAVAAMAVTQCSASGTNTILLTQTASQPTVSAYANYQRFGWVQPNTTTSGVTIDVNGIAGVNAYRKDGSGIGSGDLRAGVYYEGAYNSALNSGGGGIQVDVEPFINSNIYNAPGGYINKFRNGTMDIWQRATAGTITAGSPAYTADGWYVSSTGANVPWAQTAGRSKTRYALKVTGAASVTDVLIKQRIESYLCYPLAGQLVTVQAKVYNATGSTITPTLTVKHANAVDNWGASTTDINAVSFQGCTNATLTTIAYTFTASASAGNGLEITIDFGNNFSTSGKSVEVSELDIRAVPNASLIGAISSPPVAELRAIDAELSFCQRYLAVFNFTGTPNSYLPAAQCTSTTAALSTIKLPRNTRANVTGIVVDNVAHFGLTDATGSGSACNAVMFISSQPDLITIQFTIGSASLVAGNATVPFSSNTAAQIICTGAEL